jgi:hypothetical protein
VLKLNGETTNFFEKIERQKRQRQLYHPWKKNFGLEIDKNDTGLWSLLSPWKNWFHGHWKKTQIDGCTRSKLSVEKNPPDIEKTSTGLTCHLLEINSALITKRKDKMHILSRPPWQNWFS